MDTTSKTSGNQTRILASIVASSEDAIYAKTLDGIITQWNKGAEKIYGYTAKEAIGQSVSILTPPDRNDELPGILARIRKGEHVEHYETGRVRKDASLVYVSISISPILDAKGVVTGASTIARDITGHRRLEEALRKNIQLESANKILDSFGRAIAHELRNPLTVLKGNVFLLLKNYGDKLDSQGKNILEMTGHAVDRISGIVADLQDLCNASCPEIHCESVDLSSFAHAEAARLQASSPKRRVDWRIADGLVAKGDAGLLRMALSNLLRNAWKFTAKTEKPIIEFGMSPRDGVPVYFVMDNGAGFDMADAHKLFQPFSRLHGSNEFVGTGIGLTIVENVIRRHNGRVWAEGKVQEGATFRFTLAAEWPGPMPEVRAT
ncbi:MAG: PAS domain S-box protein [Elusimicrobia bacterium]|nr:PAS domain S-box protein [Elusimicrobiota bacterium]